MAWTIEYYNDKVLKDVLALPRGLHARYIRLTSTMELYGPNIGGIHTKHLRDGLFELRLKSKEGIARAMYCTVVDNRIIILHCFIKKSRKTPQHDMETGLSRLREVKRHDDT